MNPDEVLDVASSATALQAGESKDKNDEDAALRCVTELSVAAIAACDAASLSIVGPARVTTRAATGEMATVLDEIQYRAGEGPCLDAIRTGTVSRLGPPSSTSTWPSFWQESQTLGLARTLSAPVRVDGEIVGSLNLYCRSTESDLTHADELLVALLATSAATALAAEVAAERHQVLVEQLNQALVSRDVIGQAKGILMAREGCTPDEAFDMMRRASQRLNQKLRDVAEHIAASANTGSHGSQGGTGIRPSR
jgi:GAF domain-containing protein